MLNAGNWISIVGLLVTIGSLLLAQLKANKIAKQAERISQESEQRKDYKLKIYQMLLESGPVDLGTLTTGYQNRNPNDEVKGSEIRKSVYEMVAEGTIIAYDDATFGADSVAVSDKPKRKK